MAPARRRSSVISVVAALITGLVAALGAPAAAATPIPTTPAPATGSAASTRAETSAAALATELSPTWTLADRPSNIPDIYVDPASVSSNAVVDLSGNVYYGTGLGTSRQVTGAMTGTVAEVGGRIAALSSEDQTVISEQYSGADRRVYPVTDGAQAAAVIPGGWLELGYVYGTSTSNLVVWEVLASAGVVSSRTAVGNVFSASNADLPNVYTTDVIVSSTSTAFTVYSEDNSVSYVVRFVPSTDSLLVVAPESVGGIRVSWHVTDLNQSIVLVATNEDSAADRIRTVTPGGTSTTWTPPDGWYNPRFIGTSAVWNSEYNINQRGNADGTVTTLAPAQWYTDRSATLSIGTTVFSNDYRYGFVATDVSGGSRITVVAGPASALQITALSLNQGNVSWIDNSAVTSAAAVVVDDQGGPRSYYQANAWARTLTPTGPGAERAVNGDVINDTISQNGANTYVYRRDPTNTAIKVTASGATTSVVSVATRGTPLQATAGQLLATHSQTDGTGTLVNLATSVTSTVLADAISDGWRAWVVGGSTQTHAVMAASLATSAQRTIVSGSATYSALHLVGSVLVWVTTPASGTGRSVSWIDLADPTAVVTTTTSSGIDSPFAITGSNGWFVVTGFTELSPGLFGLASELWQVGITSPRATLADAGLLADVDDRYVTWSTEGQNGTRLVAAALPAKLPLSDSGGLMQPVAPTRIVDTRSGLGFADKLAPGQAVSIQITGRGGIPSAGVAAVIANVTVTEPTAAGNISVYPSGVAKPLVSNVNFVTGQSIPNLVTVPVGADGKIVLSNNSTGTTHLIVDVAGFYRSGAPTTPGAFASVTPARIVDTRSNLGFTGKLASAQTAAIQITGRGGIPSSGVGAVIANVTVTEPTAPGNISVYPSGVARPSVSNVNFVTGQSIPNLVTVPVGADGKIVLSNNSTGASHLIVDVAGYYLAGTPSATGAFVSLTPTRILDTRSNLGHTGKPGTTEAFNVQITGQGGIPGSGVATVVANLTVTEPTAAGNISAYPAGIARPAVSNVNFTGGESIPNLTTVPLGAAGQITLSNNSTGSTHLILDVAGYFIS